MIIIEKEKNMGTRQINRWPDQTHKMDKRELVDAGCFISRMNELLMIDPLYINYAITHYFNSFINNKDLLPTQGLNGIYFPNAKVGMWSSFAIREKGYDEMKKNNQSSCDYYSNEDKNENNIVLSVFCFNNSDFMHEFVTIDKIERLNWELYKANYNEISNKQRRNAQHNDDENDTEKGDMGNKDQKSYIEEPIQFSNYFTNVLTTESGQIGLFCVESIKNCASSILKNTVNNEIIKKDQLDAIFEKNLSHLEPWYNKICDLTYYSSIGIIDFMDRPIGCVCATSNTVNVANYLCEIVKDEVTNEIWAIKVNFMSPLI